jgi:c-di-GMP-binding flagellar brake protein YcgR
MDDRRQFIRLSSRLKASCNVLGDNESLGTLTRNVSGGGMSLFTKVRVPTGTVVGIEVFFPGRVAPVRFTAEVVWSGALIQSGEGGEQRAFETGVRFLDIAPEDRAFILQYASKPSAAAAPEEPRGG